MWLFLHKYFFIEHSVRSIINTNTSEKSISSFPNLHSLWTTPHIHIPNSETPVVSLETCFLTPSFLSLTHLLDRTASLPASRRTITESKNKEKMKKSVNTQFLYWLFLKFLLLFDQPPQLDHQNKHKNTG